MHTKLVQISWRGRPVHIEHQHLNAHLADAPLLVFLHEGLGSIAMWRDYPQQLCDALEVRGLVYSRPGYGLSTPRQAQEHWGVDLMHQQAHEVLPALLQTLGVSQAPWLFGHSDGGSIALLYAASRATAGVMVLAPHIMVEDVTLQSIERARLAYEQSDLRSKLARHHADVDSAFGAGTTCGWRPNSGAGRSKKTSAPFPVLFWRFRASTTNTAPWHKFGTFNAMCRKPNCWNWATAAIGPTAINRRH